MGFKYQTQMVTVTAGILNETTKYSVSWVCIVSGRDKNTMCIDNLKPDCISLHVALAICIVLHVMMMV